MIARSDTGDRDRPWTVGKKEKQGRVVVVDDHTVFRQALVVMLEHRAGFEVCAEAASPAEARTAIGTLDVGPDLVILDLDLLGRGVEDLIHELSDGPSEIGVICLTSGHDLAAAIPANVTVLGTDVPVDDILAAARQLVA
jgi:DNA-binding NarL/FixJ family response regulator